MQTARLPRAWRLRADGLADGLDRFGGKRFIDDAADVVGFEDFRSRQIGHGCMDGASFNV